MSLFVSIASYRDPELVPTLRDLLANADANEGLRVCVCDQVGPEAGEFPADLANDPRIERFVVPWQESRGACWARAAIMKRFRDEDFFLQLDSHHRFVKGWDTILRDELARTGRAKAILTGYVTAYEPGPPERRETEPLELHFDAFHPNGIVVFRPVPLGERKALGRPVRARFLSAHFLFAHGAFVREVPYDEELYFIGEEISLTVRAFLEGWYFYHPSRVVVFHEYTRAYRPFKHWTDHEEGAVAVPWWERDGASKSKVAALLLGDGRGSTRSLAEYEAYAGLSFVRQRAHPDTLAGTEPPTAAAPGWDTEGERYAFHVDVPRALLDEAPRVDLWQLWVRAEDGTLLLRRDVYVHDLERAPEGLEGESVPFPVAFDATLVPRTWGLEPCADPKRGAPSSEPVALTRVEGDIFVAKAEPPATYVTALLDLGRDALVEPRAYAEYRGHFARLALALGDARLVVHCDPSDEAFVRECRGSRPTVVRALCKEYLGRLPFASRIDGIRGDEAWRAQAPYLATSPQAALAHYAALVLRKLVWLAEEASAAPDTTRYFWVDAGLTRTVRDEAIVGLGRGVLDGRMRFFAYPYPVAAPEIHGLSRALLSRFAGKDVDRVLRGGFFGGAPTAIRAAREPYEAVLRDVLAEGGLGTEESLFAVLHARGDAPFADVVAIGEDGIVPSWAFGRAPWEAKVPSVPDRLAFARASREVAALDRTGAPAHLRFRGPDARAHAALIVPYAHEGDWVSIEEHGAPTATMAFVTAADVARTSRSLVPIPNEPGRFVKVGAARPAPPANAGTTKALYLLTYQAPAQLEAWLASANRVCPELLRESHKVLIDNSTDPETKAANDAIARAHGFEVVPFANVGIMGGRIEATRHFLERTACEQMWYFEDDMHLGAEPGLCRSGFPRAVPGLVEVVTRIVEGEAGLDGLKLSYTELFGCHQLDWAWVNSDEEGRANMPSATVIRAIRATGGVSYALGDVHYSNWPMVLARRGAKALFGGDDVPRSETAMMAYARAKMQRGELRLGVLLASPIEHRRAALYDGVRREG